MKVLLDTHVLLWYVMGTPGLTARARGLIDAKSELCLSVVSLWEIAIKANIGKLQLNCSFDDLLVRLDYLKVEIVTLSVEDTQAYLVLPMDETHRDPFDRMLVCQVMTKSLVLLSGDTKFDLYPIQRIWD
jgi:PIN domain nuclease of toxin-antitoxin system